MPLKIMRRKNLLNFQAQKYPLAGQSKCLQNDQSTDEYNPSLEDIKAEYSLKSIRTVR